MANKAFKYTDEHIKFLTAAYMKMSVAGVAAEFEKEFGISKTPKAISSALKSRGIKCGRGTGELAKGVSKLFTPEQVQWFKDNYPLLSRRDLTAAFNKKFSQAREEKQIVAFLKNNKIQSGRTAHFKKGQIPWSKGTKGVLKANSGSFKKGQYAHNHLPIGSERKVRDGYIEVKVAEPHKWVSKQRIIWEERNGPIPANHNIRFRDGNPENFEPDNLFMVNRSEHQVLNAMNFIHQPEEIKDTTLLLARISSKTIQLSKGEQA